MHQGHVNGQQHIDPAGLFAMTGEIKQGAFLVLGCCVKALDHIAHLNGGLILSQLNGKSKIAKI